MPTFHFNSTSFWGINAHQEISANCENKRIYFRSLLFPRSVLKTGNLFALIKKQNSTAGTSIPRLFSYFPSNYLNQQKFSSNLSELFYYKPLL